MTDPFPSPFRDPGPPVGASDAAGETVADTPVHGIDGPVDGARRRRLVLLLAGAGLLVLGGGGAAAVSLFGLPGTGGDEAVTADAGPGPSAPSADPSVPDGATGTGTATGSTAGTVGDPGDPEVGRNVFAPLVQPDAGPDGTATATSTTGTVPVPAPVPVPTAQTLTVPGPTVTSTQILAGPTGTTTVTGTVTRTVTSTTDAGVEIEVVSVADTASATSAVTFRVDGTSVAVPHNGSFGPAGAFTYTGYDTVADLVAVTNGSLAVSLPIGASVVVP